MPMRASKGATKKHKDEKKDNRIERRTEQKRKRIHAASPGSPRAYVGPLNSTVEAGDRNALTRHRSLRCGLAADAGSDRRVCLLGSIPLAHATPRIARANRLEQERLISQPRATLSIDHARLQTLITTSVTGFDPTSQRPVTCSDDIPYPPPIPRRSPLVTISPRPPALCSIQNPLPRNSRRR